MRFHRLFFSALMAAALILTAPAHGKTVRISVITDGDAQGTATLSNLVKQEIQTLTRGAHEVIFPEHLALSGQYNTGTVDAALDQALLAKDADLVITLGEVSSHLACQRRTLSKPVIAGNIIDVTTQQLPNKNGTSGIFNLNYINTFSDIDRALQAFRDITPFYRVVILADEFMYRSIPQVKTLERRLANEFSLQIRTIPVGSAIEPALDQIPGDTDAVFVARLQQIPDNEFMTLVNYLIEKKLPSFAFKGRTDVEKGLLFSILPEDRDQHLARSVAINVQELLDGAQAQDLTTTFSLSERPSINMATARQIGIHPGWSILTEADLLNEEDTTIERQLDIFGAVAQALENNPDLAAAQRQVAAGTEQVNQARSSLLPQLGIGSNARIIDDDRAKASFGSAPERQWTGSMTATQLIYSDKAWAGYTIEQHRQRAREEGRNTVELDIVRDAATAYLNVLRAKSLERIQKDNLKLTRENLERAQIRVSIGAGGPEEVYRWESQIAGARRQVIEAESLFLDAVTAVNRVLNTPLSEPFAVSEEDYKDPFNFLPNRNLLRYMENPKDLNRLRDFLIMEGMDASPELARLDAAIEAQQRSITLARREYYIPTVSLFGDVTETFEKSGEGSAPSALASGLGLSSKDDTDWTAGISLNLPLYTGGNKTATLKRALEDLEDLKFQKRSARNAIETRILNSVYLVRASFPSTRLTVYAADSARRNLTLVTDSYVRGIKYIIDLIDAQNQYLVAEQQAANAVYTFLIDLMTVQRALGNFFIFAPEQETAAFMDRLETFMATRG